MTVPTSWFLVLSFLIFSIGLLGVLLRKNVLVVLMSIELMLNAANLSFVSFASRLKDIGGISAVFFVLVVAAAEVVVGLAIVVSIYRKRLGSSVDDLRELKG